jgi:hypothetical protein
MMDNRDVTELTPAELVDRFVLDTESLKDKVRPLLQPWQHGQIGALIIEMRLVVNELHKRLGEHEV